MHLISARATSFYPVCECEMHSPKRKAYMPEINATDLTKRPPRSPRVRLGGYAILPRMLDKGRATVAGKQGEFKYNCPLDEHFVKFAGINPAVLKKQLAAGKSDSQVLAWIESSSTTKPSVVQ